MRIKGFEQSKGLATKQVILPRPDGLDIELRFTALPFGFDRKLEEIFPLPMAPAKGWERNAQGRLKRDRSGNPVPKRDVEDPAFKRARREMSSYQALFTIFTALSGDPQVEFDSKPEAFGSMVEFCQALGEEFKEWGLSFGDTVLMLREAFSLSNLPREQVEEIAADFAAERDQ